MTDILHFKVIPISPSAEGQAAMPKGRVFHLETFDLKAAEKGYQLILDNDVIHLKSGDALMLPGCCLQVQIESAPKTEEVFSTASKRNDYQENFNASLTPLTNFEERDHSSEPFFKHEFYDASRAADHFFPTLNNASGQDSFDPLGFLSGQESSPRSVRALDALNWQQELNTTQQPTLQNYFEAPQHVEKEELKVQTMPSNEKREANILRDLGIEEQDEEEAKVLMEYGNVKQRASMTHEQSPLDMMNDFFYENQE